ncbi:hypothetical protein F3K40_15360 [Streptomyces sp. LBUM 1478]|uniref:hypothetical protein n=1 Tax=Streptomyces scabiei TaxID=1930 RepID=UPI0007660F60|nr:hypothetical protein [Streptomyces scabiei]MBP5906835.1 hypothetical protein [Streptomyces sp. LBUM 1478]MBP5930438.1 hypothetical protein [Streptomyces sp. LBUM 1479]
MSSSTPTSTAAVYAAAYAVLTAAHEGGDYIVQRDTDARDKGKEGHEGRAACIRHVTSYTATQGLALLAADRGLRLGLNWRRAAAGLALSAGTHYLADRCAGQWATGGPGAPILVRAAHAVGKGTWLERDPGAGPLLDQAWHKVCIGVAAAVAASGRSSR